MDTFSRILDSLHFNGSFYFATNFHSPWGIEVPQYKNVARFHYVSSGLCWVRIKGDPEAKLLSTGDIIVIPHGTQHILSDSSDRKPIGLDEAFADNEYDGQGVFEIGNGEAAHSTQLVCGHFEFSEFFQHPFVSYLPNHIIKHQGDGSDFSWLKDTLNLLSHAANTQHSGSSAIIKRLSEVIFIQMIRYWNDQEDSKKGFVAALTDQHLASGLRAFHDDYAAQWTVEKLARASNMSRSLFADKFKQYLDLSPMQYVTNWRMQNARTILAESDMPLDNIANKVGYESAAAFSKAFKRLFDMNPGEYRRKTS